MSRRAAVLPICTCEALACKVVLVLQLSQGWTMSQHILKVAALG
jgi:hypothetical protein